MTRTWVILQGRREPQRDRRVVGEYRRVRWVRLMPEVMFGEKEIDVPTCPVKYVRRRLRGYGEVAGTGADDVEMEP